MTAKKAARKKTAKKAQGKPGRKPFEPMPHQRNIVSTAAGFGLTHDMIANLVVDERTGKPISKDTLRKYFVEELASGNSRAAVKVSETAYNLATSGDCPAMTMFWLKTRLGWRETSRHELVGAGGGPIKTINSDMTPEEAADAYRATLDGEEQE